MGALLLLSLWGPSGVRGQAPATGGVDLAPPNGHAATLRPTARRRALSADTAYAPVQTADDQGQTPELDLFVGESRVLPAPGVGRIAVGNGQILTAAALDKKEILLFANGVGVSSLFIWNEDGRYQRLKVNIVRGDTTRVGREIAAFLAGIPDARTSIVGDKVIIEGDHLSDTELEKVKRLESSYPQIVNFTSTQGWEKMIMMDVKVVEFPRSQVQELGLKWSPTGGGVVAGTWAPIRKGKNGPYQLNIPSPAGASGLPITGTDQLPATLYSALNVLGGFNLGLNAQLSALAQDGKAVVLAEPQLSTRSGSSASFQAGGEFPYVVSTINGPTVQFKPYGIRLEIRPTVDRRGFVRATLDAEVSAIDGSVSTPEGPALKKRSTRTEFNVRAGETLVLSGMLSRDISHNSDKVPWLGDLPLLGALFSSRRFQNIETELVVFVTPMVVDAQTPAMRDRVERTLERLEQQMGPAPFLTDPLQPERSVGALSQGLAAGEAAAPRSGDLAPVDDAAFPAYRVVPPMLALRAAPEGHAAIVQQLPQDAVLTGRQGLAVGGWLSVQWGVHSGWVPAQWVQAQPSGAHHD